MRDQWYGDNRDVVKWSTLVHLARQEKIPHILQIAMFRPDDVSPQLGKFRGGRIVSVKPLPEEVVHHFSRDLGLNDIRRLAEATNLCIDVIDMHFTDRTEYFNEVCERIEQYKAPVVAFLDPDTGLAPKHSKPKHVTESDVVSVFNALGSGSILVCYQHRWRGQNWEEISRRRFARWTGVTEVKVFKSELANDAIFLAAKKS